jgi:anti-sigma regulatory factor (Ser/Thr protein kinase)
LTGTGTASGSWPAESANVPAARRMVRDYLRENGRSELAENAELLVSELVGNVVLHVGGTVAVRAHAADDEVLIEVSDDSPVPPVLRAFSSTASTGRGMRLVHSLAAEHGVRARTTGKTIWARVTVATLARGDGDLAEAFAEVDWLAEIDELSGDPPRPDAAAGPSPAAGSPPAPRSLLRDSA